MSMDKETVVQRILDASDDDPTIRAVHPTGESDEGDIDFVLVIAEKVYEGREMLKIRYFAMHKGKPEQDTWMQNGITMRSSDTLISRLAADFTAMHNGLPDDATLFNDLRGHDE